MLLCYDYWYWESWHFGIWYQLLKFWYHDNPQSQEPSVCQLQTDMRISWEVLPQIDMWTSTSAINPFHAYVKLHVLNSTHLGERARKEKERKKPGSLSERKTEITADAAPISWISSTAFSAIKLQVIWLRANERHTWNSVKVLAAELACFANSPDAQLYCDSDANRPTNLNIASCPDNIYFF